jgi:hypothetical protein
MMRERVAFSLLLARTCESSPDSHDLGLMELNGVVSDSFASSCELSLE